MDVELVLKPLNSVGVTLGANEAGLNYFTRLMTLMAQNGSYFWFLWHEAA